MHGAISDLAILFRIVKESGCSHNVKVYRRKGVVNRHIRFDTWRRLFITSVRPLFLRKRKACIDCTNDVKGTSVGGGGVSSNSTIRRRSSSGKSWILRVETEDFDL